jgi:EAL domain-containing protein (putative c-di-GMP-specific phosphodiesterase class I)
MPGTFIPVAEENGLIIPLGTEIFRQVCAFLATGMPQECGLEYIEVNLSMAQFDDDNPADFIRKAMEDFEIRPDWINLEITETANATTRQAVLRNMDQLIKQGMRFALDDFGTGRSNLDYFVTMPVDIIKFDYKFTQWYFKSRKAKYVIESLIQLMNRMELPIVAEGVETKEQLDTMCNLGVAYIQGFYFSKPLPKEQFIGFLKEQDFPSVQAAVNRVE